MLLVNETVKKQKPEKELSYEKGTHQENYEVSRNPIGFELSSLGT